MNDKEIFEAILRLIGRDDELLKAIAESIGTTEQALGDFVDFIDIPELTRNPISRS